jgi:hypothetical protein
LQRECLCPSISQNAANAYAILSFHIGTLEKTTIANAANEAVAEIEPIFLNKTKWKKGRLVDVKVVSHDSRVFKFALEKPDQVLGLVRFNSYAGGHG